MGETLTRVTNEFFSKTNGTQMFDELMEGCVWDEKNLNKIHFTE
jgi:hypothetical protein